MNAAPLSIFASFLTPASPVLTLFLTGSLLIGIECFPQVTSRHLKTAVGALGALLAVVFSLMLLHWTPPALPTGEIAEGWRWLSEFARNYRMDSMVAALCAAIGVFTLFGLVFLDRYFATHPARSEMLALTIFVASGMMVLVSAQSFILIFLGIELLSLPTYVLVGMKRRDKASTEAALKYFLFGSFATVLLVFGIALIYAQTGTMRLDGTAAYAQRLALEGLGSSPLFVGGMLLVLIATAFKVGAAPFHMWVPDAYQGAPTPVTGFMGSAVKLAGFALAARLFWSAFLPIANAWAPTLAWLAVLTMFVGNAAALAQNDLKRMFAYSSVSHAGFLLLALTAVPTGAEQVAAIQPGAMNHLFYYLVVYGLMFLGLFGAIALVEDGKGSTDVTALSGLGFQRPMLGVALTVFAISGAGLPPTAGFFAKYFIFLDVVASGRTALVVAALVASLLGVYYYLRVVVQLYMREPGTGPLPAKAGWGVGAAIGFCAVALLYFAMRPEALAFAAKP
jgi:NADH-quinone oxidoreductase subunit N